ncbi:hypothetical protein AGABI1DRAFT_105441 [Agaricus bisporus var. burnettii JB137-S8]|uniref:DUF6534 domain-containing protein n=1 Tax=Agaricus bisporus var. burnettii (strain JB137-S8 / ATCC MYA-4627 / FGSC 10392) TaxID=597362 RepID=K5W5M3_AGABU|nr:uncharacterized protein AGABI1DRAFT_105441 [Agaricus bisporus var. burnettii JB137-S8]EKM82089.1 hypothetical protein AGABI1DRAFT_105441 [Agaricus bisporus var. burnettii JB137-S8]
MAGPAEVAHGSILIGTVINILLFGIMIAQVYIYYTSYRRDTLFLKLYVLALFLVDTINTVFNIVYIYVCLILHFGDGDYLTVTNWQFATGPALTGVISLMVQLFFAWRIHMLTRNWFLVSIVSILSLASAICAFLTTYEVTIVPQFVRFQEFKGIPTGWLASAVAADITITTILVWHLRRRKTGFKKSDLIVDRIIRMTVQTGLATSVIAAVDLALYLGSPSGIHLLFNFTLCKFYSNSLMSSLNSRNRSRHGHTTLDNVFGEGPGQSHTNDHPTDGWQEHDLSNSRRTREKPLTTLDSVGSQRTGVYVHVESHEMRDVETQGKDLVENRKVVVPSGINYGVQGKSKEPSFSSLSDTCDHKGSVI